MTRRHRASVLLPLVVLAMLGGCVTPQRPRPPPRPPAEVRAQLERLLPDDTADRAGWATDIQSAFQLLDIPSSTENLCAALAVTAQESTFVADPVVPGLARIARNEIDRRAEQHRIPGLLVRAALKISSPDGKSYGERIAAVRTEKALSEIFEDFIDEVPMGRRLFGDANPVRTGGPMQVSIAFARAHADAKRYPYPMKGTIRDEVFTRRGGLYFGIAHLLDYPATYDSYRYRFADFNAGHHASRNAAFQKAVSELSGTALALDGDLLRYEGDEPAKEAGATESAVRSLARRLEMGEAGIRRDLARGRGPGFERTELHARLFRLADARAGKPVPRAVVPKIDLASAKFTRKLTTEWFATRVVDRFRRCIARAAPAGRR